MIRNLSAVLVFILMSAAFASPAAGQTGAGEVASWDFVVYLNDKKVGKHEFKVIETGGVRQVQSEASLSTAINTARQSAIPITAWLNSTRAPMPMANASRCPESSPAPGLLSKEMAIRSNCLNVS